jgi:hypothetical protein
VHPGRHQPSLQLTQHRAADSPVPPCTRQADPHHPGAVAADRGHRGPDQFLADHRHHGRLVRPDGRDQVGQAEGRRLTAGRRVLPQPDGRLQVIGVEVADPSRRHHVTA